MRNKETLKDFCENATADELAQFMVMIDTAKQIDFKTDNDLLLYLVAHKNKYFNNMSEARAFMKRFINICDNTYKGAYYGERKEFKTDTKHKRSERKRTQGRN